MTTPITAPVTTPTPPSPRLASRLVNGLLAVKPLADLAKHQARTMMIKRAESIGVYWRQEVQQLRSRGGSEPFSPDWNTELAQVTNPHLTYPDYYCCSFHAYEEGNLGWEPALEVEVAAHAVHARIWEDAGAAGDARLRQSFLQVLKDQIAPPPQDIVDLGCSVGMSTFALQALYPTARLVGVDLSPYFLAIAQYRSTQRQQGAWIPLTPASALDTLPGALPSPTWVHAAAEATGLPAQSADLVTAHLVFHELPQSAAIAILHEARRLLRPGGHLAIMDMNPQSEIYAQMPPYILTLLKSTEPYLDEYFGLTIQTAIYEAGFTAPQLVQNTPRHRTLVAQAR